MPDNIKRGCPNGGLFAFMHLVPASLPFLQRLPASPFRFWQPPAGVTFIA